MGKEQGRGPRRTAVGLGLFSVALGVAEIVAPDKMAESLGLQGKENLLRAYGLREIAAGLGILLASDPTPWLWARVGGDALDLATLGAGANEDNPKGDVLAVAIGAVAAVTVVDVLCARAMQSVDSGESRRARIARRTRVPPHETAAAAIAADMRRAKRSS